VPDVKDIGQDLARRRYLSCVVVVPPARPLEGLLRSTVSLGPDSALGRQHCVSAQPFVAPGPEFAMATMLAALTHSRHATRVGMQLPATAEPLDVADLGHQTVGEYRADAGQQALLEQLEQQYGIFEVGFGRPQLRQDCRLGGMPRCTSAWLASNSRYTQGASRVAATAIVQGRGSSSSAASMSSGLVRNLPESSSPVARCRHAIVEVFW